MALFLPVKSKALGWNVARLGTFSNLSLYLSTELCYIPTVSLLFPSGVLPGTVTPTLEPTSFSSRGNEGFNKYTSCSQSYPRSCSRVHISWSSKALRCYGHCFHLFFSTFISNLIPKILVYHICGSSAGRNYLS